MSEASERFAADESFLSGVLTAVDDPAFVCDRRGTVRACNDAFDERTAADAVVRGSDVERFLDWTDEDAVARAFEGVGEATATAELAGDGRCYSVTARPLSRDDVVGAVVTLNEEPDADWPVYQAALDAAPDNVYVVDTDYRIRAVSDGFTESTKIPTAEVTGKPLATLAEYGIISDRELERGRDALDTVFSGAESQVTYVSEPAIGGARAVECRIAPIRHDGEVVGAVNVVRDVTERERVADARRSSEERLRTILETLPVAMLVVDGDGRIDHVQGLDFDGVPCDRSDLIGAPIEAFRDLYGDVADGCQRALAGESSAATAEIGERTYEAVFEPVREDDAVTGTIAVAIDITDRVDRERELAATNERLDVALDDTDAGVFECDIGTGRAYWHETTSRLFGLDPDVTDRPVGAFVERVHPDDRDRVQAAVDDAVAGDGNLSVEYRLADDGADPRWFVSEGKCQYEDGEPTRLVGTVRDVTDRKCREKALAEREQRLRDVIESSADPIAMQDPDGNYRVVNEAMIEVADSTRDRLRGATPCDVFDRDTASRLEAHRRDVLATEAARVVKERVPGDAGRDRVVQLTVAPYHGPDDDVQGTVTIARDITELERQRDELETLTAIQELVQESVRGATTATTREEIKRTVCDRLADSAFYEGAWIGSRAAATKEIAPDYAAGVAPAYLDEVTITVDTDEYGQGPGGTAYRTGTVQIVDDVSSDPDFEPWRDAAVEHGFASVAVIPLTHGSTTHGILALYTDRPEPFSDREVEGFETLGAAVGFALTAAQQRRLLESDRVLELEYDVESDGAPFVRTTAERDCRFVFENAVHAGDGRIVNYLTVEGADPELGADVADQFGDSLVSIRRLDGDGGPHFEMKWDESVFGYVSEAGGRGVRGIIEDGVGRMHVEAPSDVDVRRVTDAVEKRFDDVSLAAKCERDRTDAPWWHAHGDIGARLTDRQRGVLQAAYYSGYYEWPRDTDAETLADSLDVATPTLLQHLRKGHRRVLEAMFDA